ncbi:MAG: tRNA pseudouridine(55) synthase TruB [Desertimonas sp.]
MARRRPPTVHGVAVVDKPAGVTSHDVVGMLRRRFGERRVGHAGTLDPGATGVLVVGVGHVTRLLRFVTDGTKRYTGEVVVGVETDSLDADGTVTATHEMAVVDASTIRSVIQRHLLGEIEQVPPMVSALKVDGRRLHEMARQGIEVERAARAVRVEAFDVTGTSADPDGRQVIHIDVTCSAGTYVRTLAADLGRHLGGGAHLRHLRRTVVAPFTIDEAAPPDDCELLAPAAALRGLAAVTVEADVAARVVNGAVLDAFDDRAGPWALFDVDGEVLAVYERHRHRLAKPAVVIPR